MSLLQEGQQAPCQIEKLRTPCLTGHVLRAGEQDLPCALFAKGQCRPAIVMEEGKRAVESGIITQVVADLETKAALHRQCPNSSTPLLHPSLEELAIQRRFMRLKREAAGLE